MNTTQTRFAINFVLGGATNTLVVSATDRDDAFFAARDALVKARLYSAALQGSPRAATEDDIDSAFGIEVDQLEQPFCACGRVVSRCDGSRARCGKGL